MDNRIVRNIQNETTKRKKIQADVDITRIQEQYMTMRHKATKENTQTFRNTSDEIINSLDKKFYTRKWQKKGVRNELELSPLSFMMLMGYLSPMVENRELKARMEAGWAGYTRLWDNMQYLHRVASAGNLDFDFSNPEGYDPYSMTYPTPPPENAPPTQYPPPTPPPPEETEEKRNTELINTLRDQLQRSLEELEQRMKAYFEQLEIYRGRDSEMGSLISSNELKVLQPMIDQIKALEKTIADLQDQINELENK